MFLGLADFQWCGIEGCPRLANDRRNKIPASHPYDKKTGLPTKYLRRSERDNPALALTGAYQHVMNLLDPYI